MKNKSSRVALYDLSSLDISESKHRQIHLLTESRQTESSPISFLCPRQHPIFSRFSFSSLSLSIFSSLSNFSCTKPSFLKPRRSAKLEGKISSLHRSGQFNFCAEAEKQKNFIRSYSRFVWTGDCQLRWLSILPDLFLLFKLKFD